MASACAGPETTVDVRQSLIRFNSIGITPDDNTEIGHNTVVCNITGISIASEDDPLQELRNNNVCHNRNASGTAKLRR